MPGTAEVVHVLFLCVSDVPLCAFVFFPTGMFLYGATTMHMSFDSFHVHDVSELITLVNISCPYYDKYYVVHAMVSNGSSNGDDKGLSEVATKGVGFGKAPNNVV